MIGIVGHVAKVEPLPYTYGTDIIHFVSGDLVVPLVVPRGHFVNQRGFYIPEGQEVVPDLIAEKSLTNRLTGPNKNIVGRETVRGVESVGLFYGSNGKLWNDLWLEGDTIYSATDSAGATTFTAVSGEHMSMQLNTT